METITLSSAIIATVEFLKRLESKVSPTSNFVTGPVTFIVAIVLGALWAFVNGGNLLNGVMAGAAAAGFHTVASVVGNSNQVVGNSNQTV